MLEGRAVGSLASACHESKLNYEDSKHLAIGDEVFSDASSAVGHLWKFGCCPYGEDESDKGEYISFFVHRLTRSRSRSSKSSKKTICNFSVILMDKNGEWCHDTALVSRLSLHGDDAAAAAASSWRCRCVSRDVLEERFLTDDGYITLICSIMVLHHDGSILVPASDIGEHFGTLLDSMDGVDISFTIDSETIHAHKAVLAARSPVFKAELFGSMAEAAMSNVNLHGIAPSTFKLMLRFIYTDAFPGDDELGDSPFEMTRHLLAAADRYALDRLKLICAQRLLDDVLVDTVGTTLVCAEMYSCLELKSKCIDFFLAEENFKKAVLTKGFVQLVQRFPSIVDELRERVGL